MTAPGLRVPRVTMDQNLPGGRWATTDEIAIRATPERVFAVLIDIEHYGRWWPGLRATRESDGPVSEGVTGTMTRGGLAGARWRYRLLQLRAPVFLRFGLDGDLEGTAAWEIEPAADHLVVRHCWYGVRPCGWRPRLQFRLFESRWHHWNVRGALIGLQRFVETTDG